MVPVGEQKQMLLSISIRHPFGNPTETRIWKTHFAQFTVGFKRNLGASLLVREGLAKFFGVAKAFLGIQHGWRGGLGFRVFGLGLRVRGGLRDIMLTLRARLGRKA